MGRGVSREGDDHLARRHTLTGGVVHDGAEGLARPVVLERGLDVGPAVRLGVKGEVGRLHVLVLVLGGAVMRQRRGGSLCVCHGCEVWRCGGMVCMDPKERKAGQDILL